MKTLKIAYLVSGFTSIILSIIYSQNLSFLVGGCYFFLQASLITLRTGYYLVTYKTECSTGSILIKSDRFIDEQILKGELLKVGVTAKQIVVLNVEELSRKEFNEFNYLK